MLFREMEKCLYSFYVSFDLYYKYIVSYTHIYLFISAKIKDELYRNIIFVNF